MNDFSQTFSGWRVAKGGLLLMAGLSQAFAATFTDTTITGEASILKTGTVLVANNTGGGAATTINGIAFASSDSGLSGGGTGGGDFSDQFPAGSPLDIVLSTVHQSNFTLTLSGLTSGASYTLQLLMADDLQNTSARIFRLTFDGTQITETLPYTSTGAKDVIIDFVATSATDSVTFRDISTGLPVLNGYVLETAPAAAVPEPSYFAMTCLLLAGLGAMKRRRRSKPFNAPHIG